MNWSEAAERGFYERLVADAQLATELGAGSRIVPGWPADTLQAADLPRITFFVPSSTPRRPTTGVLRIQTDIWVWPSGTNGGRSKLLALDERMLALIDEQHWIFDQFRLYGLALAGSDMPAGPDEPMRRRRDYEIRS